MKISDVLNKLDRGAPLTKTAAETAKAPSLDERLDAALAQVGSAKTASAETQATSPVAALAKVAAEVAAADEESNIKLAQRMGRAFVDGQVERMAEWEKAAADVAASAPAPVETESEKQAAFEQGFNETAELIHKAAAAHFVIGHDAITAALGA